MSNAMQMINLTIIGRVIADPITEEVMVQGIKKEVTKFRIIYSQDENKTIVFNCSAWNGLNKIAKYLKKGRLVCITSSDFTQKLRVSEKDSKTYVNNYLTVNGITLLDKKPANNSAQHDFEEVPF